MKNLIFMIILLFCVNSKAQKVVIKDLSNDEEMNYIFSRINSENIISKELYNRGMFVTVYEISDSKSTPEEYMEDFLSSYIISVSPDGDYYSNSKLYKIEGIYNPKILEIKESESPKFLLKIEYGIQNKRKFEVFEFIGVQ